MWQDPFDADRRIEAFARIGFAHDEVNEYDSSAQVGLILRRPFSRRAPESLGFAVAAARTGDPFRRAQRTLGTPIEAGEAVFEITYRRALCSWLTVQPGIQYILNPGADRSLRDALVLGLRIEFAAERSW